LSGVCRAGGGHVRSAARHGRVAIHGRSCERHLHAVSCPERAAADPAFLPYLAGLPAACLFTAMVRIESLRTFRGHDRRPLRVRHRGEQRPEKLAGIRIQVETGRSIHPPATGRASSTPAGLADVVRRPQPVFRGAMAEKPAAAPAGGVPAGGCAVPRRSLPRCPTCLYQAEGLPLSLYGSGHQAGRRRMVAEERDRGKRADDAQEIIDMRTDDRIRRLIAREAARIMYEEGAGEYRDAKRKAAKRFGPEKALSLGSHLPTNAEIHEEFAKLLSANEEDQLPERLPRLRLAALAYLELFSEFSPYLVGSVLSGAVTSQSDIDIHLFADSIEEVENLLDGRGIGFDTETVAIRKGGKITDYTHIYLDDDGVVVECSVY